MYGDKVSAVMVTGKTIGRLPFALASIRSFVEQTYDNKELVIVTDHAELYEALSLTCRKEYPEHNIRVFKEFPYTVLGALRNIGLRHAAGEYIAQWDDDDWSASNRIETQMRSVRRGEAALFNYQIRYSFLNNSAFELEWFGTIPGIPGTVLFHRFSDSVWYRTEKRHEDSHLLVDHFKHRTVVIHNAPMKDIGPDAYIRFFHGQCNTWDHKHVMREYTDKPNTWALSDRSKKYLAEVLKQHYSFESNKYECNDRIGDKLGEAEQPQHSNP